MSMACHILHNVFPPPPPLPGVLVTVGLEALVSSMAHCTTASASLTVFTVNTGQWGGGGGGTEGSIRAGKVKWVKERREGE